MVNNCPPWVLEGRTLPQTNINDTIKYLGGTACGWGLTSLTWPVLLMTGLR